MHYHTVTHDQSGSIVNQMDWMDVRYDAIDGAGEEDIIYVRARTYVETVDMGNRLMLIGDCTGVRTADTKILM